MDKMEMLNLIKEKTDEIERIINKISRIDDDYGLYEKFFRDYKINELFNIINGFCSWNEIFPVGNQHEDFFKYLENNSDNIDLKSISNCLSIILDEMIGLLAKFEYLTETLVETQRGCEQSVSIFFKFTDIKFIK